MTSDLPPTLSQLAARLAPSPETDPVLRLLAPRPPLPLHLAGRDATLVMSEPEPLAEPLALAVGGTQLHLPADLVDWLLRPLSLEATPADPAQQALLLELALLDLLPLAETALDTVLRLTPTPSAPTMIGLRLDTADGTFTAGLHTDDPAWLADQLDNLAPPETPDPSDLPVRIAIRLGRQMLTAEDVASLAPGDIVMLEPGPPLAIAEEAFAAALTIQPGGAILQSDLLPLPLPPTEGHEFHADLARTELTFGALRPLGPGDMLPLAAFSGTAVDIRIGDTPAGRGERVEIGSGTGIRILHLLETT